MVEVRVSRQEQAASTNDSLRAKQTNCGECELGQKVNQAGFPILGIYYQDDVDLISSGDSIHFAAANHASVT
jgi:hypothetical protein